MKLDEIITEKAAKIKNMVFSKLRKEDLIMISILNYVLKH